MRSPGSTSIDNDDTTVLARRRVLVGIGAVGGLALAGATLSAWTTAEAHNDSPAIEPVPDQTILSGPMSTSAPLLTASLRRKMPPKPRSSVRAATGAIVAVTGVVAAAATGVVAIGVAGGWCVVVAGSEAAWYASAVACGGNRSDVQYATQSFSRPSLKA